MSDEIFHEYVEGAIVCPWCGHEITDLHPYYERREGYINCHSCGKSFRYEGIATFEWSTERKEGA